MTAPGTPAPASLQTFRTLAWSLMGALVVLGAALVFVYDGRLGEEPELWTGAVVVIAAVVLLTLIGAVGYRTAAIVAGTPEEQARTTSLRAFQTALILRFALCEPIVLIALVLGFVTDQGGFLLYVVGVAVAAPGMYVHVLPSERAVARIQESLEREGGLSYLRQALGADA
ncbi:MAG TPA: hypothetical protein VLI04_22305 [Nocardioidaceae bacterium]|nr:hypothetical protein [Nocardioidaceae bacterium]